MATSSDLPGAKPEGATTPRIPVSIYQEDTMSRTLPLLGAIHPLTGLPVRAIGRRRDGRPIFPIMGAADPERPEGVTEEEWGALGDPGKQALVRERANATKAEQQAAALRAQIAKDAKPTPPNPAPKPDPEKPPAAGGQGETPDVNKLVADAVKEAIKPFVQEREQSAAQAAAQAVRDAVVEAAEDRLHDKTDALLVDLTTVVGEDGKPDVEKIGTALDDLVKTKPHLAKDPRRIAAPGVGASGGSSAAPMKEQVQSVLAQMQTATGVRTPKSPQQ